MSSNPTFCQPVDEDARRRFESAWRAGRPEPIERFLPVDGHPDYLGTLEELVAIEMEFAWKTAGTIPGEPAGGPQAGLEAYLVRFPQLNRTDVRQRLLEQEQHVRRHFGDHPTPQERRGQDANGTLSTAKPQAAGLLAIPGYEILGEIARGGMGVVFKARQAGLNRDVAIKMILAGAWATATEVARFRAEAEAAAALRHPNIVQIYEVGEHNGLPYFSLEFMEGGSLAKKLDHTPQPARPAAELVEIVARAVHVAHQHGIIHRDLKPANVLLTGDGLPKITDFGLARRLEGDSNQTRTGDLLGTPGYMAPEQAAAKPGTVGPAADVYALGAILYEMLTGRPPFQAETPWDVLTQVLSADPVPPRRLQPKVPADLETICLKCLEKEPSKRYASAAALADDLGRFLADRPIRARPAGAAERLWRWRRRNPVLSLLTGLTALAMAAAVVLSVSFAFYQAQTAEDLRQEQKQTKAAKEQADGLVRDLQETDRQRRRFTGLSARLVSNQGQTRCEQGDVTGGMLLLARSLEIAPAEAPELAASLRTNLAAWRGQLRPLRAILHHDDAITVAIFSPDSHTILTGSHDKTARLWDARTGRPIGLPLRHRDRVMHLAFSPDGKTAATASKDSTAQLWDATTGQALGPPLVHDSWVGWVEFSPDGKTVITGSYDKTARRWDVATGRPVGQPLCHDNTVRSATFNPTGRIILTGSYDGTARLWDAATSDPVGQPMNHQSKIFTAVFSRDGKTIVTAGADGTARLWDGATGRPLKVSPLQHQDQVAAVAFSPDGKKVLTGSLDRTAQVWDVATGQAVGRPLQHLDHIQAVAYSPDGKTILTGSWDKTARLWDAATGEPLGPAFAHHDRVLAVAFSPDGNSFLTTSADGTARLWNAATGQVSPLILPHDDEVAGVVFSPDGTTVATACYDGAARCWDAATGEPRGCPLFHEGKVDGVAFSPDGKTLLTCSWDKTARLWDTASGKPTGPVFRHQARIFAAVFSPDGRTVLTGSHDTTAKLWDAATGAPCGPPLLHAKAVWGVAFSPDGTSVVTAGYDTNVQRWHVASGRPIDPPLRHQSSVWGVAFSPDGKTLVTACWDRTARLWRTATGEPTGRPLPHHDRVSAVAFSPDGKVILTGSDDTTARLWDATTGQPLGPPLTHGKGVNAVAFSPDGRTLLTGCMDGTARLWPWPAPVEGSVEQMVLWVQTLTGMELDDDGNVHELDAETWNDRRRQLAELGGPPAN